RSWRGTIRACAFLFLYLWSGKATRKQVPKSGARSGKPRHDSPRRAIEKGGNLLIRKLFVFPQDDDLAELHGKLLNRRSNLLVFDPVYIPIVRILRHIRRLVNAVLFCVKFDQIRACSPLPQLVQPNIAQDSKQPALHTSLGTQAVDRSKSSQARFLNQVL